MTIPANTEGGILSSLLNKIFKDQHIEAARFHSLLQSYLEDPLNGIPQTSHGISSARSNHVKEIKKASISWKWFIRALKILRINHFTITVTVHHKNISETNHSVEVNLGRIFIPGEGYIDE